MFIICVILCVLSILLNLFLWKTAHAGIAFYYVVYKNDGDRFRLKVLTNFAFLFSTLFILSVTGLIFYYNVI